MTYLEKEELKTLSALAYKGVTCKGAKLMQRYGMDFAQAQSVLEQVIKVNEQVRKGIEDSKAGMISSAKAEDIDATQE